MKTKQKNITSAKLATRVCIFALLALLACSGCATSKGKLFTKLDQPLYWPEQPLEPKIEYIGQFSTQDDLKKEVGSFESLGRIIFGREDIGVLSRPHALAIDDRDRLYIADSTGGVIHMMDLSTRKYLQFYKLENNERLLFPIGVVTKNSKVYVADSILAKICVFNDQGKYIQSFGSDVLERPAGLACNQKNGNIYVTDTKKHAVYVFSAEGQYLQTIGRHGGGRGTFNFPTQIWSDNDRIYVSDTLNYRIQIFSLDGKLIRIIGNHGNRAGNFAHPCGIASDSFGNIYVGDKQFENIQIFNSKGEILMAFGGEGSDPGEFWLPAAIFIDKNNRIFVADSFNKRVQVFQLLEGKVQ